MPASGPAARRVRPIAAAVLSALLTGFPAAGGAQAAATWPDPYPTDDTSGRRLTAGGYLEKAFADMLTQCGVGSLTAVVKKKKKWGGGTEDSLAARSAIPRQLHGVAALPLDVPVGTQTERSMASLFAYVFTPAETAGPPRFVQDRFLPLDVTVDPAAMLPAGSSTLVYNHSCTGVVNAALTANAGFRLPQASLEAAIKSEYDATKANVLAVVAGRFASPLDLMLRSSDPGDGLFARLGLWNWYRTHQGDATDAAGQDAARRPRYMTSFQGLALFGLQRLRRSSDASAQVGAGGSTPFAALDARLRTALTSQDSLVVRTYATAAYYRAQGVGQQPTPVVAYDTLPQPAALVAYAAEHPAQLDPVYPRRVLTGQEHRHAQTVAGVPPYLCRKNLWTAQRRGTTPTLTLAEADTLPTFAAGRDDGAHRHSCRFTVAFTPAPATFGLQTERVSTTEVRRRATTATLEYDLVAAGTVAGVSLKVPAQTVELGTSRSPDLNPVHRSVAYVRDTVVSGGRTSSTLSWPVSLAVYDEDGARVDWDRLVDVIRPTIECATTRRSVPVSAAPTLDGPTRQLRLVASYPAGDADQFDYATTAESCQLSATLAFTMRAEAATQTRPTTPARVIEQVLPPITVTFPVVKGAAAPGAVTRTEGTSGGEL